MSPATKPEIFLINMLAQTLLTDGVLNLKILFLATQVQFEVVKNLLIACRRAGSTHFKVCTSSLQQRFGATEKVYVKLAHSN